MTRAPDGLRTSVWTRRLGYFLTARTVSVFGDQMQSVATAAAVISAGYGIKAVGFALAAPLIPFAALVILGGVLTDRLSPRGTAPLGSVASTGSRQPCEVFLKYSRGSRATT